jgi:hypothetical protein
MDCLLPVERKRTPGKVDDFLTDLYWKNEKIMSLSPPHQSRPTPKFLVTYKGDIQGPFEPDFIEAMVMAQVYPASVLVQRVGELEWLPFSKLGGSLPSPALLGQPTQTSSPPSRTNAGLTKPKKTKPETVVAWIVGTFAVLVVLWIVGLVTSSKPVPKPVSDFSQNQPLPATTTSIPRTTTPSSRSGYASNTPPVVSRPADSTQIYRDASGRTYRVPNAAYHRLLALQAALSLKKTRLDPEKSRLESLSKQVDAERTYLDQTSQYAVDAFNRKVNQINALNSKVQSMVNDYNREVDAFNTELERVGTPIN